MKPTFTAHNIRLDDGSYTIDPTAEPISEHPWLKGALRIIETVLPRPWTNYSLVDLGCLEGGYAVEFARAGFNACGIEVRESNIETCRYVEERVNLPNLRFIRDNALNFAAHGPFDVTFCCGLLYHFDKPVEFLHTLGAQTNILAIIQTHFAPTDTNPQGELLRRVARRAGLTRSTGLNYNLSRLTENEGQPGRWFWEYRRGEEKDIATREKKRWTSWDNARSFWLTRPALLQTMQDVGFDLVLEQYDNLDPSILEGMTSGIYAKRYRSTFIGVKTGALPRIASSAA
jgi:SAM-dependent methyltransferase